MPAKKIIITSVTLTTLVLVQTIPAVFAQNLGVPGLVHDVNTYQNQASRTATQQQRKLSDVIARADTLITNRITELNTLSTRTQNDSRLTTDEKTNLSGQIQVTITGLTSLKTKIDADTDVQTALSDGKQIFTSYRVYEVLEPKIHLLIILNNLQTMITHVQALIPQLQNLINSLQSQGKDTSQLTSFITDLNTQLQTMITTITTDITTVQNISISTTSPQTTFTQVRGDIQNIIKTDFQKVRSDIEQMRSIFKQLILPNAHPSSVPIGAGSTLSVTPTTVPSSAVTP